MNYSKTAFLRKLLNLIRALELLENTMYFPQNNYFYFHLFDIYNVNVQQTMYQITYGQAYEIQSIMIKILNQLSWFHKLKIIEKERFFQCIVTFVFTFFHF